MLKSLFNSPQQRLIKAIQAGDVDKLARLLAKVEVDSIYEADTDGRHALEHALKAEEPRLLQLLLQKCQPPLPAASCGSPLTVLALQQTQSLAQLSALLQIGENANLSHQGQPLLHHCADHCPPTSLMVHISRLLEYGADLDARDESGRALLEKLMPQGDQALLQFLIQSGADCEDAWLEQLEDEALALQLRRVREDIRIRKMMLGG